MLLDEGIEPNFSLLQRFMQFNIQVVVCFESEQHVVIPKTRVSIYL